MMGLVGAGAIGSPFLINALRSGSTQRNTVSPTRSSSGLTVSNRWSFATGGQAKDDVPALLMDGEYVVNKRTVDKYGVDFFEKMNKGLVKGFADGGPVGGASLFKSMSGSDSNISGLTSSLDSLVKTLGTDGSGDINNNINISINIQDSEVMKEDKSNSTNENQDDNKTANQKAKALTDLIKDNVVKIIIEQKRPGGLLAKTG
jgi:hypothetical protein